MEDKYCQCCGMPMGDTNELYGTEQDGSKSKDYCKYCYENGAFTSDCTMEEMIDFCVKIGQDMGMYPDSEQARGQMLAWFPTLKRWESGGQA